MNAICDRIDTVLIPYLVSLRNVPRRIRLPCRSYSILVSRINNPCLGADHEVIISKATSGVCPTEFCSVPYLHEILVLRTSTYDPSDQVRYW